MLIFKKEVKERVLSFEDFHPNGKVFWGNSSVQAVLPPQVEKKISMYSYLLRVERKEFSCDFVPSLKGLFPVPKLGKEEGRIEVEGLRKPAPLGAEGWIALGQILEDAQLVSAFPLVILRNYTYYAWKEGWKTLSPREARSLITNGNPRLL